MYSYKDFETKNLKNNTKFHLELISRESHIAGGILCGVIIVAGVAAIATGIVVTAKAIAAKAAAAKAAAAEAAAKASTPEVINLTEYRIVSTETEQWMYRRNCAEYWKVVNPKAHPE